MAGFESGSDRFDSQCGWHEGGLMDRPRLRNILRECRDHSYLYVLCRPDGQPFYIGKGKGDRVLHHEREALGPGRSHKLNVIRSVVAKGGAIRYRLLGRFEHEAVCLAREIEEIRQVGRHDLGTGPLTNLTAGGEGASGLSEETRRRIDADLHGMDAPGERGIANRFFLELCGQVRSVPVRPLSAFKPLPLTPHRQPRNATVRMAAALAASAIASRTLLIAGCVVPRSFEVDGVSMAIENGAGADLLKAGLASVVPGIDGGLEGFRMDKGQIDRIMELLGSKTLLDAGVLLP